LSPFHPSPIMLASPPSFAADSMTESRRFSWDTPAERRYVEMTSRLTKVTGTSAFAISSLVTLSCLSDPHLAAMLLCVQLLQVPFNIWVNLRVLRRLGARKGELLRTAVNLTTSVVTGHLAHWPLPAWLWLPFIALATDSLGERVATAIILSTCVVVDGLALIDGVSWIYPAAFTIFAVFCAQISKLRVGEMREMLLAGDSQRRELESTYAAMKDAHERLTVETTARELVELELRQAHKLEAVGRLAAGVAHEINTPVQFIGDNLRFARDSVGDLGALIAGYRTILSALRDGLPVTQSIVEATEKEETLDVSFLLREVPSAVDKSLEGIERIAAIVRSVREFAQPEQKEMIEVDLNDNVGHVLLIARNEYAQFATVDLALSPLPRVLCHPGEINQVLLNLIVNAAHSIAETPTGAEGKGRITVRTVLEPDGRHVSLSVADDGAGIPEDIQRRIFEPFFTTKAVGKGTGQGLAVSRSVISRHGGSLRFESKEGAGTTFYVRLPIDATAEAVPS
jgi:signal transduction histidine kinase